MDEKNKKTNVEENEVLIENNEENNSEKNDFIENFEEQNGNFEEENENEQNFEEDYIEPEKEEKKHYGKQFLVVLSAFLLGAMSVFGSQALISSKARTSTVATTKQEQDNQQTTISAISKAKDAVVSIVNYQQTTSSNSNLEALLRGSNRNTEQQLKPAANGSGVIYKKSGSSAYLVTNNHVVAGAKKLVVILSDGTSVDAELVGTDIWTDLAVLKISGDNVTTTMDFADSDKVAVGQTAFAIGSPLDINLSNTVTKGIVSAINRQIPMDIDKDGTNDWNQTVLQTDAAINPGNSGGALINNEGQLIGINEAKISNVSSTVSAEGIGFVIPSNEVKIIVEQLEKNKKVDRAALGVQLVSLKSLDSTQIEQELKYTGKTGAVIKSVEQGTPAENAGLEKYDIITKLDDVEVNDIAAVRKYLFEKVKPGDKVRVTYFREGKEQVTTVTVQKLNNN